MSAPEEAPTVKQAGYLGSFAPALRSRNFRLFWLAQIVSTIGTSLQVIAEGYLIYDITESTFWLGMVSLLGLLAQRVPPALWVRTGRRGLKVLPVRRVQSAHYPQERLSCGSGAMPQRVG